MSLATRLGIEFVCWAVREGATPAQRSMAWLPAQKPWIVQIPTATRTLHLLENIVTEEVSFTAAELPELTAALDAITIQGTRLPASVFADTGVEARVR